MNHRFAVAVLALVLFTDAPSRAAAQNQYVGMQAVAPVALPSLTAQLIDADKKAQKKTATVSVVVKAIKLVDPDSVKGKPYPGQGHLHYRLDDGPVIATTATKLSFHELTPGPHVLIVVLASNDHTPLGPSAALNFNIP